MVADTIGHEYSEDEDEIVEVLKIRGQHRVATLVGLHRRAPSLTHLTEIWEIVDEEQRGSW